MPIADTVGAFAIVPSNDLKTAVTFWERLEFARGRRQQLLHHDWLGLRGAPF